MSEYALGFGLMSDFCTVCTRWVVVDGVLAAPHHPECSRGQFAKALADSVMKTERAIVDNMLSWFPTRQEYRRWRVIADRVRRRRNRQRRRGW